MGLYVVLNTKSDIGDKYVQRIFTRSRLVHTPKRSGLLSCNLYYIHDHFFSVMLMYYVILSELCVQPP